jgi:hypothetical protein
VERSPSASSFQMAAAVIGFVIDRYQEMVSAKTGLPASRSANP